MKKIFSLLIILVSLKSFGQVYQILPQYGYEMKRIDPTLVLKVPSDTTNNKTGIARLGTTLYVGNGTYWSAAATGTVTGSGTTNYLPKWSSSTALGNSLIFDNGTNVGIGTNTPTAALGVLAPISTIGLNLTGTALAATSAANGATEVSIATIIGVAGQEYNGATAGRRGGVGSPISITTGAGGLNSGSGSGGGGINAQSNARGGALTLATGAGGASTGGNFLTAGTGGIMSLNTGAGGNSTLGNGGNGGIIVINAGVGGSAQTSGLFGGSGGNIGINAGAGGSATGVGVTSGNGATLDLNAGAAGAVLSGATSGIKGSISIGIGNALSITYGNTTDATSNIMNGTLSVGKTTLSAASAVVDVVSTTKGVLFPRMTTTQKNAITSPAAGLVVYDTTLNKLCIFTTAWETITSL